MMLVFTAEAPMLVGLLPPGSKNEDFYQVLICLGKVADVNEEKSSAPTAANIAKGMSHSGYQKKSLMYI